MGKPKSAYKLLPTFLLLPFIWGTHSLEDSFCLTFYCSDRSHTFKVLKRIKIDILTKVEVYEIKKKWLKEYVKWQFQRKINCLQLLGFFFFFLFSVHLLLQIVKRNKTNVRYMKRNVRKFIRTIFILQSYY